MKVKRNVTRAFTAFLITALLVICFPIQALAASVSDLAPITKMSYAELVGDNGDYRDIPKPPAKGTYKVVVDVFYQFVTVFKKDDSGNYTVPVRYMPCSTGMEDFPTSLGTYRLREEKYRFKSFTDFPCAAQYWTRIKGGTYFHSILYSREDADYLQTSSYKNIGKRASHGCIRLLVPDARWIYYNLAPGTLVTITKGKQDASQANIKKQLKFAKVPGKKPDLSPAAAPVTEPWPGYTPGEKLPAGHQVIYIGEAVTSAKVIPGASSLHRTIGTLKKGTKVQILRDSYSANYFRILYKGYTAYVPVGSLSVTAVNNPGWSSARTAKVQNATAAVKAKSSSKSKTVCTINQGEQVIVLAKDSTWARVISSGGMGYILISSLKDIT